MTEDEAMLFTKKIRSEYAVKIEEAKSFYDNCIRSLRIREIRAGYEQLLKACDIIDNQAAENDALCDTIDEVREEAAQVKRDFKTDEELQAENETANLAVIEFAKQNQELQAKNEAWEKQKCGKGFNVEGADCDHRHADIGHYISHYNRAKQYLTDICKALEVSTSQTAVKSIHKLQAENIKLKLDMKVISECKIHCKSCNARIKEALKKESCE